jgi:hypothetical protein
MSPEYTFFPGHSIRDPEPCIGAADSGRWPNITNSAVLIISTVSDGNIVNIPGMIANYDKLWVVLEPSWIEADQTSGRLALRRTL